MSQHAEDIQTREWTPPSYTIDANGKIVGYSNDHIPHNWGRWGELDQRGTANFITPERIAQAAQLIRSGRAISLALPIEEEMPVHPSRPRVVHTFGYTGADVLAGCAVGRDLRGFEGSDDYLFMPLHSATHWDGLAHIQYQHAMYNGFWGGVVESYGGAGRCQVHLLKDRLLGRGVLLDLPRHFGIERLLPGQAILPEDLDACMQEEGMEVRTGDILLIRTGEMPWFYTLADKSLFWGNGSPGLSIKTVEWLYHHEVAALAADNVAVEVVPFEEPYEVGYPLHMRLIRDLGLTIGELWWLEELAEACREQQRWEFFLNAAPLTVTNAVGGPLNPIAYL